MSAAEIIEEIRKLTPAEREKVVACIRQLEAHKQTKKSTGDVSEEFERVVDRVLTTHAELFRKLAQ